MKKTILEGIIKRHADGFGFFIPDDSEHPDVYIPRHLMRGIMTSDRVKIEAFPEEGGERFRGNVIEIIERGLSTLTGRIHFLADGDGIIIDEGRVWGTDLKIPSTSVNLSSVKVKDGDLVAVRIKTFPESESGFTGELIEVLGDALDPLNDTKRVLYSQRIPFEWPQGVLEECKLFPEQVKEEDWQDRKDLRNLSFVTIDGATARDFDDAVYVEQNDEGFRLWVAIADVSFYVKEGSALDREAYCRGNSTYFPDYVVPMLPEILSNNLCSLNPNVPRLALVAEMQFDFTGEMQRSEFYEAVFVSHSRVTYGEAQEMIDGEELEKHKHVREHILRASDLAKILMAKRYKEGALDLDIPETEVILDGAGNPIDIIRSERLFAHQLIEEMMLAANVAVAKFLFEQGIPVLYRIHEPPLSENVEILKKFLMKFGSEKKLGGGKLQKKISRALQQFAGKPEGQILNILTLRSMNQAVYSANNCGHFGLGFEYYTHFTSPIRRYPDLIVHRLLKAILNPRGEYRLMGLDELSTAGNVLSGCEQRSVKAERLFNGIKRARFMTSYIGKEFDGMISSVAKFGIFVLLRSFDVDGLVRLEHLGREDFEFDEENLILIGKKTKTIYEIGQPVKVQVASTDPEAGQVDFLLVEDDKDGNSQNRKTDRSNNKKRRKA